MVGMKKGWKKAHEWSPVPKMARFSVCYCGAVAFDGKEITTDFKHFPKNQLKGRLLYELTSAGLKWSPERRAGA
jgi:hypothetical protein